MYEFFWVNIVFLEFQISITSNAKREAISAALDESYADIDNDKTAEAVNEAKHASGKIKLVRKDSTSSNSSSDKDNSDKPEHDEDKLNHISLISETGEVAAPSIKDDQPSLVIAAPPSGFGDESLIGKLEDKIDTSTSDSEADIEPPIKPQPKPVKPKRTFESKGTMSHLHKKN